MRTPFIYLVLCMALACGPASKSIPKEVERGPQGVPGEPGQSAITEVISLCPTIPGNGFNESLLRIDGQIFGVYASGIKIFLISLPFGQSYVTTDGRNCSLNIDLQGNIH